MDGPTESTQNLASILENILREHGLGILDERSRLLETLRARAPHEPRGVHLLLTAYDAGVPHRLREAASLVSDFKIGQETAQIVDNFGSSPEPARAAVETWAKVLASTVDLPAAADGPEDEPAALTTAPVPPARATQPAPLGTLSALRPVTTDPAPVSQPVVEPVSLLREAQPVAATPTAGAAPATAALVQARPKPLPLPSAGTPASVKPLPLPGSTATPLRPLPGGAGGVRPLPLPGVQARSAPAASLPKWAILFPVVLAVGAGGLWAGGYLQRFFPKTEVEKPSDPPPSQPPSDPPRTTAGTTEEGYPIAEPDRLLTFKAQQIDGGPNTLLFAFGLRSGAETFTYQAAVGFESSKATGIGLIKAVKRGKEASTGELAVTRVTEPNGYVGFTMSGPLKGDPIGAPSICVSALAGKSPDRLDIKAGEAGFCAFATTAAGVCDGDKKLGCGDLVP